MVAAYIGSGSGRSLHWPGVVINRSASAADSDGKAPYGSWPYTRMLTGTSFRASESSSGQGSGAARAVVPVETTNGVHNGVARTTLRAKDPRQMSFVHNTCLEAPSVQSECLTHPPTAESGHRVEHG